MKAFLRTELGSPILLAVALVLGACGTDGQDPPASAGLERASSGDRSPYGEARPFGYAGPVGETRTEGTGAPAEGDAELDPREPVHETEEDWAILRETVEWARGQSLHRLPVGEIMAMVGTTFVGTPYEPGTLELPGPEGLVVNLRALDCVTFVENLLAIGILLRTMPEDLLESEEALRDRYREILTSIRYRGGELDGYSSRLHYFSEWIQDNEGSGLVRDLTEELGGERDTRPIHFMSSNPDAYRQLTEVPAYRDAVEELERELAPRARYRIPEDRIESVEDEIQNGDIIATTSNVDGLDIAHTGIALRHQGRIHMIHAPLVGESVEITELPLAERILRLGAQDGVMIARPLEPGG